MSICNTPQTVGECIAHWAARTPDAPVMIEEGRDPLTYSALAVICDEFRSALNSLGYGRNDRIAIVHPGGSDMAVAIAAIWGAATAVPLNPDYIEDEIATYLKTMLVDALLVPASGGEASRRAAGRLGIPVLELIRTELSVAGAVAISAGGNTRPHRAGPAQANDTALVLCTSGTTSEAKIVPRSHAKLLCRIQTAIAENELKPQDRCLTMMPLFHGSGLNNSVAVSMVSGGSAVIMPSFDTATFFRYLATYEPTWYHAGPTFHRAIVSAAAQHRDEISQATLRLIRSATARLEPELASQLVETFSVPVFVAYSSSEAGSISSILLRPGDTVFKSGCVGKPTTSEVTILQEDGRAAAHGMPGEVAVRGPQVFDGYEGDAEVNDAAFTNGWFRTGDEGVLDQNGYLTLTGRIKESINRGGTKISPVDIDTVLRTHPDIVEAACFAIPHATLGEIVGAAIVPDAGKHPAAQELVQFLLERLTPFKIPSVFMELDQIPKGSTGKIDRRALTEMHQQRAKVR